MSRQSPIFAKTESFMVWLFEHTAKFPKHERFRLAQRINDALFDFHVNLIKATVSNDPKSHLINADIQLKLLRSYLRLAVELRYTTSKQYQHISEHTSNMGKLLGGWLKSVSSV